MKTDSDYRKLILKWGESSEDLSRLREESLNIKLRMLPPTITEEDIAFAEEEVKFHIKRLMMVGENEWRTPYAGESSSLRDTIIQYYAASRIEECNKCGFAAAHKARMDSRESLKDIYNKIKKKD